VFSNCPICNRVLKPALTNTALYAILGDGKQPITGLKAYSCGPKGHIVIIKAEGGNRWLRPAAAQPGTNGATQAKILNSWKEIAAYVGRGVRTVQRWEANLGLPVHRPKGKDRSAVLAFAEELDTWLRHTPVRAPAAYSFRPGVGPEEPGTNRPRC
jgi:hypothetical protein